MRSLVVQATRERGCASIDGPQRMVTLRLLALAVIAAPNRNGEDVSASGWHKKDWWGGGADGLGGRATRPPSRTSYQTILPKRGPRCVRNVWKRRASSDAGI